MSKKDKSEFEDTLQAIKQLVEQSEIKLDAQDDVVTLDQVVWRNPVAEAPEELDNPLISSPQSSPNLSRQPSSSQIDASAKRDAEDTVSAPSHDEAPSAMRAQSSLSVSAYDLAHLPKRAEQSPPITLDDAVDKPFAPEGPRSYDDAPMAPSVHSDKKDIPQTAPPTAPSAITQPSNEVRQRATETLAQLSGDIKDLTDPLGRRGGGFYSTATASQTPKPAVKTAPASVPQSEPAVQAPLDTQIAPQMPAKPSATSLADKTDDMPDRPRPKADVELAITDFEGADFNFSHAEGLMTAAEFESLEARQMPHKPDISVPIAPPPVVDPVAEVQAMMATQHPEPDDTPMEEAPASYMGHPNLHVVSDSSVSQPEEEEDKFSGSVRLALRSIIKEQVSSWLQGNMTDLIEEALSTPQKRPSSKSKPSSTKR